MFEWSDDAIKLIHILGATVLFGTGLGTAFQMWRANRTNISTTVADVAESVVLADWLFTAPAALLQPVTGFLLARSAGWTLEAGWLALAVGLYAVAGACWLPVVWLQIRMARLARDAADLGRPLPARYRRCARIWFWLGWPAFLALLLVFHLMIAKPEGLS